MALSMRRVDATDRQDLRAFLLDDEWPFHAGGRLTADHVDAGIDGGWLAGPGTETFWLDTEVPRCGFIRIFDLDAGTPLFDLRISASSRNQGVGTAAVRWLASYVFDTWPAVDRIEATTRVDNVAMRRVLERCGWAKESHWRRAWPGASGAPHDAVGYAILRGDHEGGTVTPVLWDR